MALVALTLPASAPADLAQPPVQLAEESGVQIGEALSLPHEVTVKVLGIVEDSRCPVDVTCIQAGRLVIRVLATRGGTSETFTMEPWQSVVFASGRLTFAGAPQRGKADDSLTAQRRGRFNFTFTPDQAGANPQPETDAS